MMLWWGYLHENGTLQVKRYFSDAEIKDAEESDFVDKVFQPFECEGRDDAIKILKRKI